MSEPVITPNENLDSDEKLEKFKLDIASDADVMDEQRRLANEDMRFVNVPGGMWEDFYEDIFDVATRVKLQLDLVSNFLQRFLGEWDSNRIGVVYKPDDSKTSDEDAEMLNSIYRSDFRNFSGAVSTDNAVDEVATCGTGALVLSTIFEDDGDPENDNMRIVWRPIHNAYNSVFWDQSSQRIDKADARWCTMLTAFTRDSFKDSYPDSNPVSAYTPDNDWLNNSNFDTPDLIYIATRYEAVKKKESVFTYNDLQSGEVVRYSKEQHDKIKDELRDDEFKIFVRERKIVKKSVEKTVFSGEAILEETRRIAGEHIPVISFYGYRSYVDGVEWYRGLVRKLKDPARLFNMQVSQLAENAASAGQEVPIVAPEQVQNKDIRAGLADRNNSAYVVLEPLRDKDGNIVAAGPMGYMKPQQLDQSTATLLGIVPEYMQSVTGGAPQDTLDPNASGKAINAMIKRENLTTAQITNNIAHGKEREGVVYQSLAAEVYTTRRIIGTIGKDGSDSRTEMHKIVMDQETGVPVEANTLSGKKFRAYSDVGPQYDSMREQTVEDLKGMLESLSQVPGGQQYLPALVAVLMDNISGVGLDPIKELNRKIMLSQGLVKPETPEEEALVQQLQQPQEDPQAALVEAAANQQNSEARSLDASSIQKIADAEKKGAETQKILADIGNDQANLMLTAQKQLTEQRENRLKAVEALPLQ